MPFIVEKPQVSIAPEILKKLQTNTHEAGQVIVHGICKSNLLFPTAIRIWKTTFLFDCHSSHKSDLLHIEKISLFPSWTVIQPNTTFTFTLIFSGFPDSCVLFDLKEIIPQSGGFEIFNISRTENDVYYLDFS